MRAILITVLFVGCGGAQIHDQEDLSMSIRSYNDGVRWERFAAAASALPPRQRAEFVDEMDERANEVKITDYEVVKVDPRGEREARVCGRV